MREEEQIQISTVLWLRYAYPNAITIISPIVKYGGTPKQRLIQGAKQKRMGYVAGTPDLFIPEARGTWHGLFIEFKTAKGGVQDNQYDLIARLGHKNYKCEICRSSDEAVKFITEYMEGKC